MTPVAAVTQSASARLSPAGRLYTEQGMSDDSSLWLQSPGELPSHSPRARCPSGGHSSRTSRHFPVSSDIAPRRMEDGYQQSAPRGNISKRARARAATSLPHRSSSTDTRSASSLIPAFDATKLLLRRARVKALVGPVGLSEVGSRARPFSRTGGGLCHGAPGSTSMRRPGPCGR
jgi:hypothetical protein